MTDSHKMNRPVYLPAICYNNLMQRSYIAIDLKSFYTSVECVERGWNSTNVSQGFTANMV